MDETPDIASLLYLDEPTAQEKAKALTAALRGQQAQAQQRQFLGALGGLTGSEGIANLGQTFGAGGAQDYKQAAQGLEALQGMPQARLQRALQQQQVGKIEADNAEVARVRAALASGASPSSIARVGLAKSLNLPTEPGMPGNTFDDETLKLAKDLQVARELARTRQENLVLAREERAAAASEKAGTKAKEELEKDVQKAGTDLADVAAMKNDLEVLQKASTQSDIPGVGAWDSRKGSLPVVGGMFESSADTQTQQAIDRIVANILHAESGLGVTEGEITRKKRALGVQPGASENQFRQGLQGLMKNAGDALRGKEAKYRPDVISTLRERGGKGSADLPTASPAASGGEAVPDVTRKDKNGKTKTYRKAADGTWEEVG